MSLNTSSASLLKYMFSGKGVNRGVVHVNKGNIKRLFLIQSLPLGNVETKMMRKTNKDLEIFIEEITYQKCNQ